MSQYLLFLDLRTLNTFLVCVGVLGAIAFGLTWQRYAHMAGLKEWAIGVALLALGGVGLTLRGLIWLPLTIIGANTLVILGHCLLWVGTARFRGLAPPWQATVVITLCAFLSQSFLYLVIDSIPLRVANMSILIGLTECLTLRSLIQAAPHPATLTTRATAAMIGLNILVNVVRSLFAVGSDIPIRLSGPDPVQGLFMLASLTLGMGRLLGHLTMVSDRLQEQLNQAAHRDFLTQLYNRRAFKELAEQEVSRAGRHGQEISLMMLDLDHFKRVNDTQGHRAGDEALQAMGQLLGETLRQHDLSCRYGGEEFCVLLPQTDVMEAQAVAERIRIATPLDVNGLTVSIGVTQVSAGESLESAMDRADHALYQAKQNGRNRIEVAIPAGQ